ncbi:MAG: RING finger protein [Chlamydia sp.]
MEPLRRDYTQTFHDTSIDPAHHQMLCFQCEEYISRSAHSCPYCRAVVSSSTQAENSLLGANKITSLHRDNARVHQDKKALEDENRSSILGSYNNYQHDDSFDEPKSSSEPLLYILSLLALIIGSALLFLGSLFPLVAHDGQVTLTWNESLWIPFLIFGVLLMYCGYRLLQRINPFFEGN